MFSMLFINHMFIKRDIPYLNCIDVFKVLARSAADLLNVDRRVNTLIAFVAILGFIKKRYDNDVIKIMSFGTLTP